ncbi:MAG: PIN domain-containing protein [Terracidiphilus sp.]|jgi:predicted nucleic acid-binding protein
MGILIDADVIIAAERGTFDLRRWLNTHMDEQFEVAAITVAELWHGAERATSSHKAWRQKFIQENLAAFEIIPYTEQTAFHHARLWADLESKGQIVGAHDLILAATALERGNAVATFNKRHFAVVNGLEVIVPV